MARRQGGVGWGRVLGGIREGREQNQGGLGADLGWGGGAGRGGAPTERPLVCGMMVMVGFTSDGCSERSQSDPSHRSVAASGSLFGSVHRG